MCRNCSKNPTEEVVARVKEMGETFCMHYVQVSGNWDVVLHLIP